MAFIGLPPVHCFCHIQRKWSEIAKLVQLMSSMSAMSVLKQWERSARPLKRTGEEQGCIFWNKSVTLSQGFIFMDQLWKCVHSDSIKLSLSAISNRGATKSGSGFRRIFLLFNFSLIKGQLYQRFVYVGVSKSIGWTTYIFKPKSALYQNKLNMSSHFHKLLNLTSKFVLMIYW